MGKNFPAIYSLKEKPTFFQATVELIERSFKYSPPNSFLVDFSPLMDESNHHNCFILIDESEAVLAHVAAKERAFELNGRIHGVCMLGGIAVDERHRGQGHFQTLFQDVLAEKRGDNAFFLLWSDQEKLYSKFGFELCGGQYELPKLSGHANFRKTTYKDLSSHQKTQLQELYDSSFRKTYHSLSRSQTDWELISKVTSAELHLEEEGDRITGYAFRGKGQDLEDIVYELGSRGPLPEVIESARVLGKVWSGAPIDGVEDAHYQFLLAPADTRLFSQFIADFTNGQVTVRDVNHLKQEVYFDFNGETLGLEVGEFLKGILGPGPFEELGELKPLFISGLDSI